MFFYTALRIELVRKKMEKENFKVNLLYVLVSYNSVW